MGIDKYNGECRAIVMRYSKVRALASPHARTGTTYESCGQPTMSAHCAPSRPRSVRLQEWEATVERMGRWIDFKNDYKTLDPKFMESVWWVFSELFKKGLVYTGFKVRARPTAREHCCGAHADRRT